MKKLIAIICILLAIFIGMYIYQKKEIQKRNVTAEEVTQIEEYISKIYMWKEVTKEALPIFNDVNEAPERWIWEVVKKNIENYEDITHSKIQEKAKSLFGESFKKNFEQSEEIFVYNEETNLYEATNIELDSDNDTFLLNKIEKTKEGYQVEIVEYIEDYSEEQISAEGNEEPEFDIHIKNIQGEEIVTVKNTEGKTKIIEKVKENIEKFSIKQIELQTNGEAQIIAKKVIAL